MLPSLVDFAKAYNIIAVKREPTFLTNCIFILFEAIVAHDHTTTRQVDDLRWLKLTSRTDVLTFFRRLNSTSPNDCGNPLIRNDDFII